MLKKTLTKLKGKVIRNWSEECTHLCMNAITVTEKVKTSPLKSLKLQFLSVLNAVKIVMGRNHRNNLDKFSFTK